MKEQPSTVIVIDDDAGIRESLGSLLRSVGYFQSVQLGWRISSGRAARKGQLAWCLTSR
jgi:DNA-binding NtrC family response regulator